MTRREHTMAFALRQAGLANGANLLELALWVIKCENRAWKLGFAIGAASMWLAVMLGFVLQ